MNGELNAMKQRTFTSKDEFDGKVQNSILIIIIIFIIYNSDFYGNKYNAMD